MDAAIAAAGHARAEKKQAEAGQRAAEARTQEVLRELENTTGIVKRQLRRLQLCPSPRTERYSRTTLWAIRTKIIDEAVEEADSQ